jgi:CspA family cold shock protein
MPKGKVKFFSPQKGYGFILDDSGKEIFVHFSNIEVEGFKTLEAGQEVEYNIGPGKRGDEAQNVRIVK